MISDAFFTAMGTMREAEIEFKCLLTNALNINIHPR